MRAMQCRQVAFAMAVMLAGFGCGSSNNNNPSDAGPSGDASLDSGGPSAADAQAADAGGAADAAAGGDASADASTARSFDVTATDYKFTPALLTVAPGAEVTVTLKNDGTHTHNILFDLGTNDQPTISSNVAAGDSGSVTFTAPAQTGSYVFFCPVDAHRDLGMVGSLKVQ
jgi:plastocyanin